MATQTQVSSFSCCNPLDSPVLGLAVSKKGPRTSSSGAEAEAKEATRCFSPKKNNSECNEVLDRDQGEGKGKRREEGVYAREERIGKRFLAGEKKARRICVRVGINFFSRFRR